MFELKFVELLSLAKTRTKAKAKLLIYFTVKKLAFNKTAKGTLDLIPSKPGDHSVLKKDQYKGLKFSRSSTFCQLHSKMKFDRVQIDPD